MGENAGIPSGELVGGRVADQPDDYQQLRPLDDSGNDPIPGHTDPGLTCRSVFLSEFSFYPAVSQRETCPVGACF